MPRERTRNCGACGAEKVVLGSGASRCIPCHNRRGREYYRSSSHRRTNQRNTYTLRKYGITLEHLALLLEQQNGCCAICSRPWQECVSAKRAKHDAAFLQYLCVDHDHKSGKVRGLLCNACNTAIGMLEEDASRFHAAVRYLKRHA